MVQITARENLYNALASARDGDGRFARSLEEASQLVHAYDLELAMLHADCVANAVTQGHQEAEQVKAAALDAAFESGKEAGRREALEILRGTLGEDAVDIMLNGGTIVVKPMEQSEVIDGDVEEKKKEVKEDEGSVETAAEDDAAAGGPTG